MSSDVWTSRVLLAVQARSLPTRKPMTPQFLPNAQPAVVAMGFGVDGRDVQQQGWSSRGERCSAGVSGGVSQIPLTPLCARPARVFRRRSHREDYITATVVRRERNLDKLLKFIRRRHQDPATTKALKGSKLAVAGVRQHDSWTPIARLRISTQGAS